MAESNLINPLTKDNLKALKDAAYKLSQAQLQIETAEAAGLEMGEETMRVGHLRKQVQALLDQYSKTR